MVKFTSSVVVVGFLGLDVLQEKLKGESIVDVMLKLMEFCSQSMNDPLLMAFGTKLLNRGWRKFDRDFVDSNNNVNAILKSKIH